MEYRIFGPGGSPSEDFRRDLQGLLKLDDAQRGAIADWFFASKNYDPFESPLPGNIVASTLLPEQFRSAAQTLRGLLWAWQEYGLQLEDIERDLLLLGIDSEALGGLVSFLGRLSAVRQRVWACEYERGRRFDGLPTIDILNFVCEARAIFGGDSGVNGPIRDAYRQFLGVTPVVIMELITSDNYGNKERTAIQLSEDHFEWLRKAVERAHEQLSIMKDRMVPIAFDGSKQQ